MNRLARLARIATDPSVLKLAAPAYALPFLDLALAPVLGFPAAASVWYLLFGPAVGLHALLTMSVANKADDTGIDVPQLPSADELSRQLTEGFADLHARDGVASVQDLVREYQQLQPILARRRATDSVVIAQVPILAMETYSQGLSVLGDALELLRASSPEERERLLNESRDIEDEIADMRGDPDQAGRIRIREDRLTSNRELLSIMNQQRERVDQLLFQSERCEASLRRTRMELAGMQAAGSEDAVSSVVETLRLTLSHARGVQDEMKRLGSPRAS